MMDGHIASFPLAPIAMLVSFLATAAFTGLLIPGLKKLKFGQNIREDGPKAHFAKQGTPTMGGIAMALGVSVFLIPAMIIFVVEGLDGGSVALGFLGFLLYAIVGFLDDFLKIKKHQNEGLTVKQKFALEILFAVLLAVLRCKYTIWGTTVFVPFAGNAFAGLHWNMGFWAYPFFVFVIVAMTNAVNLTDGLDGLASSVTTVVALFFALFAYLTLQMGQSLVSFAIAGACMGFLVYNHNPAKVFMGDTGSLALGGGIAMVALSSGLELLLPVAGFVYVAEALSVILQVGYFKATHGKRLFRMAPIHHHFELGGMSEKKVVRFFTLVSVVCCVIAAFGILRIGA